MNRNLSILMVSKRAHKRFGKKIYWINYLSYLIRSITEEMTSMPSIMVTGRVGFALLRNILTFLSFQVNPVNSMAIRMVGTTLMCSHTLAKDSLAIWSLHEGILPYMIIKRMGDVYSYLKVFQKEIGRASCRERV